ncbi:hypothetical protein BVRB_3g048860 [Beta vulgaris subsp. vulgaris]|nr:hypothetical protein BVRB_3g048860 [Beta vulgaris subsp. vulgaris]
MAAGPFCSRVLGTDTRCGGETRCVVGSRWRMTN